MVVKDEFEGIQRQKAAETSGEVTEVARHIWRQMTGTKFGGGRRNGKGDEP